MANINNWTGTGNLVRDPEARSLATGKSVTAFTIAVSTGYGDKKTTMYLDVSAWEKLGSFVQNYAHKGSHVAVTGALSVREYEAKDGTKRKAVEIRANEVELLDKKSSGPGF